MIKLIHTRFRRIQSLSSADEFYSLMGVLTQDMMDGKIFNADNLIKVFKVFMPPDGIMETTF